MMPTINRQGCTRIVILTCRLAIKLPNVCKWRLFLHGLLANMQERAFGATGWLELCPVLWALPGGWLVIMPRAVPLTDDEFLALDVESFAEKPDYRIPVEAKTSSFGWLNGRIVAIDYGS